MKKILNPVAVLILLIGYSAEAAESSSRVTGPLVWCGLDYSKVKMIGSGDFREPDKIFPGMLVAWNTLFNHEMIPGFVGMAKSVKTDLGAVTARNEKASPTQIIREDGTTDEMVKATHITEEDIAQIVRSYELQNDKGLGLVFVMDRLVKSHEVGCLYVVYFDIATRKVLSSDRVRAPANGFGFRNYWFYPVKIAARNNVPKMYKRLLGKPIDEPTKKRGAP